MSWLNRVCSDCRVSHSCFRVAYVIADHLNSGTELAWPSQNRIAEMLNLSAKSVQRATKALETIGWLAVLRNRKERSANRYKLAWPRDCSQSLVKQPGSADKNVPRRRQTKPGDGDKDVRQSYLANLPKTYLSGLSGEAYVRQRFPDRGAFEERIVSRFGSDIREIFERLEEIDPAIVDRICLAEKMGCLAPRDIDAARRTVLEGRLAATKK